MHSRSYIYTRSGSRDGVALIMVLAFIVLLTILIVAFISFTGLNRTATASYSKSIQAQEVAQAGLQDILTDLHQEILAGSTAATANGTTVYPPVTNWASLPARLGYAYSLYGNEMTNSVLLPPTLVRVSRASQDGTPTDFYPWGSSPPAYYASGFLTNRASNAKTSTASVDGRSISAARWNKIDLLTTNTTLGASHPFATNLPDWVYVTRGGSRACSLADVTNSASSTYILPSTSLTSTSQVIGRYAYVIYDEGALLDINSAGYISSATTNFTSLTNNVPSISYTSTNGVTQLWTGKTYSSYADLTQLPGITNQTTVDTLVKWRNSSISLTNAASAGSNYYQMVANNATNGFLVSSSIVSGGVTNSDSPLLGRLDLINYMASVDPTRSSIARATPYLGTFSRAANAPSWHPTLDATNLPGYYGLQNLISSPTYSFVTTYTPASGSAFTVFHANTYKANAESTTDGTTDQGGSPNHNPNRDIPGVRYASTQSITHYNDDGTSYSYTVKAGDPVMQHRFSLAKLSWLTSSGPSSTAFNSSLTASQKNAAILACFGLQWDAQDFTASPIHYDRWKYVAATTTDVHILSLDEIAGGCSATANAGYREPNFFETIKAGILSGSLGQSPGPMATTTAEGPVSEYFDLTSSEKNRHILQIGANIIDQADSDSIPTAIYLQIFSGFATLAEDDLAFNTVYGDENLPGLDHLTQQVAEDWFDPAGAGSGYPTTSTGSWKTWILPEIWNIHQAPPTAINQAASGVPGYPHPTQFRIHAYGKISCLNRPNGGSYNSNWPGGGQSSAPMDYDDTTTKYPYHDASSTVPPTGTYPTYIYGGQTPSSSSVSANYIQSPPSYTVAPPAGFIYFTDGGNASTNLIYSAASPYYRYPEFLSTPNIYSLGGYYVGSSSADPPSFNIGPGVPFPWGFKGTSFLNIATTDNDCHSSNDGSPTWAGIHFVALFAGEDPNFWSVRWIYHNTSHSPATDDPTVFTGFIQYLVNFTNPLYVSVECQDPTTLNWHPYNFISRLKGGLGDNTSSTGTNYVGTPGVAYTSGTPGNNFAANVQTKLSGRGGMVHRPDPRTDRFSVAVGRIAQDQAGNINVTQNPQPGLTYWSEDNFPWRTWGFVYSPDQGSNPSGFGSGGANYPSAWSFNSKTGAAFYVDPDGVVRPGDSYRRNTATGDGCILYHGTGTGNASAANTTKIANSLLPTTLNTANSNIPINSGQSRRPMILNRPFRSVGELGYAFRDLPFKTIDFFSASSGDGALLDLFSVTDEPSVSAGEINLSNAPASILTSLMVGATKMEIDPPYTASYDTGAGGVNSSAVVFPTAGVSGTNGAPNFISHIEAGVIANSLVSSFTNTGPIDNRADLVTRLDPILTTMSMPTTNSPGLGYLDYANKAVAEAPIRALGSVTSTRTWNLLIDIIAQSGQMSPNATTLDNFVVQGERRYWLHIAIDRYTGKILDQQLEPIYE